MPETFSSFTYGLILFAVLLALGIIFEKQLIALEDKLDKWFEGVRENVRK